MKASRLTSLAAVAAAFLCLGCLAAAAQAAPAPQTDASVRPIMAPPAAAKKAAARKTAPRAASNNVHVYLFRGLLNVFSLGMDELADKIKAAGIAASVHNHTEWEEIAGQIAASYKNGNHAPIILIGHSLGADAVMYMADSLGKRGVPVALVVPFDGTQALVAPGNVARVLNLTQRDYAYARRGSGFHGELKNVDVSGEGVDHLNIDKSPRLHALVLSNILAIVKKGETPASFASVPAEEKEKERPKSAPKPEPAELAARPEPSGESPAAAGPAETPKSGVAPVLRPSETAPPPVSAPPAAVSAAAASPPVSAPPAAAPQPASAPAKPAAIPPTERLEYEKLVLPKQ